MTNDTIPTKTCTRCGNTFPATLEYFYRQEGGRYDLDTYCKECKRQRRREYSLKYPEREKEYKQKYRADKHNREKEAETKRKYNEKNRAKIVKYRREYRKTHLEQINERFKRFHKNNPEKNRIYIQRRAARKRSLPSTFTNEQWVACLNYFNYCCAVCGNQLLDLFGNVPHADHWIPLSYEGGDNPGTVADNMVCLCSGCNWSKKSTLPDIWLIGKYGKRKANEILKRIEAYFATVT